MKKQKSFYLKEADIKRKWVTIDANGEVLGRLATKVANILRGKTKAQFTPSVDGGDFVVIVNAEKIRVTGKKLDQKVYETFSGYPGGVKTATLREKIKKEPAKLLYQTVERMLPNGRLARQVIKKLKVYKGETHPHQAQVEA